MSLQSQGRSLELYFIDGRPDGMLTAEVFNWTGHVLMAPRTQIRDALSRPEARHAGAYILLGERDGEPLAYIGEGDDISLRIKNHDINKDWWTSVAIITTSANNLHKAHAQYIEARLIEKARSVGRMKLDNGNSPARPTLNEAARANMESFLDYLYLVLPAVRVDMFLENTRPASATSTIALTSTVGAEFELTSARHALQAVARLVEGEFIVEAGSTARSEWEGKSEHTYRRLYDELVNSSVLLPDGAHRRFASNYAFKSPSAAAAVIFGRAANGQTEWKQKGSGLPYKEWEARQIYSGVGAAQ
ncbi:MULTISPECIES: GIY-YIG nuclease family protein [Agrobacterium]|uniref:GIY-YIG nuclease family protein n=1 Tax=Agrobacterium TaxID=357 RepID=UPI0023009CCB|nr:MULTISPECIES: GIY-YIG nuclease family protein [Agrobacterium]MDA5640023.1 GIY-YIG nuclease family protein [Agrobacterium sp. ST15.13.013]MDA6999982.1 GIY-YIG nuclease family protein [Agrobacterium salinitolerans]